MKMVHVSYQILINGFQCSISQKYEISHKTELRCFMQTIQIISVKCRTSMEMKYIGFTSMLRTDGNLQVVWQLIMKEDLAPMTKGWTISNLK